MAENQIKTITVDGTEHPLTSFSEEVQKLVAIHQQWEGKLVEKRLDLALVEAAIRDLTRELSTKIKEQLDAQVAPEVVAEEAAPDVVAEDVIA
jgi:hypothetical protein